MVTTNRTPPPGLGSDPHARLGLAPGASTTEIKRAYRRLVMRYHPDLVGDGSLADFLAVKAAYEALLADPGSAMPDLRRTASAGGRVVYRPTRPSRPTAAAPRAPEWRDRATGWSGGRWYWEGLGANAARRARS